MCICMQTMDMSPTVSSQKSSPLSHLAALSHACTLSLALAPSLSIVPSSLWKHTGDMHPSLSHVLQLVRPWQQRGRLPTLPSLSRHAPFFTPKPLTTPCQPPVVTMHVAIGTATVATPWSFLVPFDTCSEQEREPQRSCKEDCCCPFPPGTARGPARRQHSVEHVTDGCDLSSS
jgi:hypothetical protein